MTLNCSEEVVPLISEYLPNTKISIIMTRPATNDAAIEQRASMKYNCRWRLYLWMVLQLSKSFDGVRLDGTITSTADVTVVRRPSGFRRLRSSDDAIYGRCRGQANSSVKYDLMWLQLITWRRKASSLKKQRQIGQSSWVVSYLRKRWNGSGSRVKKRRHIDGSEREPRETID